jgi:ABC-type transport system involved in cytochrome c biogenesis permease subunit
MLTIALAPLAFVSALVLDYVEAHYIMAVQNGRRHRAAHCSILMWAIGALGFLAVLEVSPWLMLPEGLGFYVGTLLAMKPIAELRQGGTIASTCVSTASTSVP